MGTILIYVQHLLGIGHLMRARVIAESLADAGFDVHLVTGGMPIGGRMPRNVHIVQLPPIRVSDASFTPLRDGEFNPIDDAYRARRRDLLLAAYDAAAPAAVLFETFPFGRRSLRFELVPLARAHRGRAAAADGRRIGARDPAGAAQARARARDAGMGGALVRRDPGPRRPALRALRGDLSARRRAGAARALHGLRADAGAVAGRRRDPRRSRGVGRRRRRGHRPARDGAGRAAAFAACGR